MTSPILPQENQEDQKTKQNKRSKRKCNNSKCYRHALKIKTKCCRYRCDRALRRKLHRYKLRPNGEEDPEVIDVSHVFLTSLKIKSPTKLLDSPDRLYFDDVRPINYLTKMAKRKLKLKSESYSAAENSKNIKTTKVSPLQNGKITAYTLKKSPNNNGRTSEDTAERRIPDSVNGKISTRSLTITPDSQEKKQTNAFKLLMDSRNKSIGMNSPGKEKHADPSEVEEINEKKSIKVKRNLALQKMAEAKGSLKNKEREELEEKCIQRKMEKRAERLKKMIANTKPIESKKDKKKSENTHIMDKAPENMVEEVIEIIDKDASDNHIETNNKLSTINTKKTKKIHLVDIFSEVAQPKSKNTSPLMKKILKEDEEFLKKLSPSIKKKENMLCYFTKIEKKCESPVDPENNEHQSPVIKVKMSLKNKNTMKKKKLCLNKDATTEVLKDHNENSTNDNDIEVLNVLNKFKDAETVEQVNKERKKRKRKENLEQVTAPETSMTDDPIKTEEGRPKRKVKRPIKYEDDVHLSSSDEELHIFTPRKRRHVENKNESLSKEPSGEIIISDEETNKITAKSRKNKEKIINEEKKPAKLAPIFVSKPLLNPERLEAKQKFLYSGVPDEIKKKNILQKNSSIEIRNEFPLVVHVQQILENTIETIKKPLFTLFDANFHEEILTNVDESLYKKLIASTDIETITNSVPTQKNLTTTILQNIKDLYPKFPVYRTYRNLKSQSRGDFREVNTADLDNSGELICGITDIVNEDPEYLNWTDKYKARSTKHLIGNFEGVKEMKKWLTSWTESDTRPKPTVNDSDSSDFCYDSDSNSRDCIKSMNNLLILTGPPGCGKTSSVYAVAAELAIKVIEVNASSKRTGKMMLQDLQEATQSHKVNRAGLENSQKIQEVVEVPILKTYKKRGRPKKLDVSVKKSCKKGEITLPSQPLQPVNSQESVRTGMSLILVDDGDIVFDQDDGFSSAIAQLIQSSKRPVILVTGSLTCPHLQKFLQCGKVIYMNPLLPRMLGTWLDLVCLADKGTCWPGLGAKFLDYFRGDIRKTINCLQFYTNAHLNDKLQDKATSQNSEYTSSPDDEGSNMSWPDSEGLDEKNTVQNSVKDDVWKHFMDKQIKLQHVAYPENLLNVWWSLPAIISSAFKSKPRLEAVKTKTEKLNPRKAIQELDSIANLIDTFSISDLISNSNPNTTANITSMPWYSSETSSVSELECLNGYKKNHEVTDDILQNLVTNSLDQTQKSLQCEGHKIIQLPSMTEQRSRDRIIHRHEYISDMLNPSATLDRRALALDYWSTCRSICRIEKNKTDVVLKRNNRFCHYLKSMNASARNDTFDSLGDSLSSSGEKS